ncbi:Retrovirus-related Pol polyprotein from transposon 412 [Araneus ventricosus]|uniref:Retrovirus-related Pol polyprotein from transposon 412 n=1 Tax=Araneus ventricosus TaxID=182803 RepID=A0A4Y2BVM5_ARAVE|nr:Retrovirus-related Pol polyprotein from transposon 412 [Araneus ventricosus]
MNSHCSQTTEDQVNLPQSLTENKYELRKEVKDIIKNFDSVFSKGKYDVGALRVEPQKIVLNSDFPVSLRSYHTSPVEEQEIKSQVEKLLQSGLIKENNSPYSSPVTLAFKRDEGKKTRLCIDFRKLNALCKSDSEPLPLRDSLLDKLSKAKIFSSLDLVSGFKKFLRNYNVKHLLTTAHHPQTNGKVERVNQSLVTRLKCEVNSSSTKVPWTELLESVTNEYNLTPHSITKYPPAYLLLGTLSYDSPIGQNSYYEPANEARNLALQRTMHYHNKNKIRYDARFVDKI